MADNPPTAVSSNVWTQLAATAIAALAPVLVKALVDVIQLLQQKIGPWDGTERRGARPPDASTTP